MLSSAYRFLTNLGAPVISLYLWQRRRAGREDKLRFKERFGYAALERPQGRLVWFHAASIGEAASLLILIETMRAEFPSTHILMTTGTVTSARMLKNRLPVDVLHQYMPVDRAPYVKRFLDHWQPDLVVWVESDLWPNMLAGLRERRTPALLLNARMSEASFRKWYRVKDWAKEILGTFALCLAQTETEGTRFSALGARGVACYGNLKYAARPLPYDDDALTQLKSATANRPLWLMASTHHGEERIALETHKALQAKHPELLTIIVPRHAVRGPEIARLIATTPLKLARRSAQENIAPSTDIYLADTMGELGLFYRLSPLVCLAGSFQWGGHNPIEPAQLGCTIVVGPHMRNFAEVAREFSRQHAIVTLHNENELTFAIDRLLTDGAARMVYGQKARIFAEQKGTVLEHIMAALKPWLTQDMKAA
jgi:3-deoxy-D-manno-octulosonic-acid transferase